MPSNAYGNARREFEKVSEANHCWSLCAFQCLEPRPLHEKALARQLGRTALLDPLLIGAEAGHRMQCSLPRLAMLSSGRQLAGQRRHLALPMACHCAAPDTANAPSGCRVVEGGSDETRKWEAFVHPRALRLVQAHRRLAVYAGELISTSTTTSSSTSSYTVPEHHHQSHLYFRMRGCLADMARSRAAEGSAHINARPLLISAGCLAGTELLQDPHHSAPVGCIQLMTQQLLLPSMYQCTPTVPEKHFNLCSWSWRLTLPPQPDER